MRGTSSNKSTIAIAAVFFALLGMMFSAYTAFADSTSSTGSTENPGLVPDGSDTTTPAPTTDPGGSTKTTTTTPSSGSSGGSNKKTSSGSKETHDISVPKQTTKKRKTKRTSTKHTGSTDTTDNSSSGATGDTGTATDPLGAGGDITSGPVSVPNLVLQQFQIPPFLLPIYQAAGTQYDIPWQVLAAINEIETDYGRNLNVSSAGAVGWMQFMPSTWALYGVDANNDGVKDPYNPVDAIFAAAKYLKAAGGSENVEHSIFAYNHAQWYVDQVMLRAKLIAGVPDVLIDSLTGLTQGHFPVYARSTYAGAVKTSGKRVKSGNAADVVQGSGRRNGIKIYSRENAPVIAVQDSTIVDIGSNSKAGNFVVLEDSYGNHYRYSNLGTLSKLYPVPRGDASDAAAQAAEEAKAVADPNKQIGPRVATKQRVYAHPDNARDAGAGAYDASDAGQAMGQYETFDNYFARPYGLKQDDVVLKQMKKGSHLIGGTIIGRLGADETGHTPYVDFQVRPAGSGAPVIDPKPILDGWKLLDSTAVYRAIGLNPLVPENGDTTIGQILLMSKEQLEQYVLDKKTIKIYAGGRNDIKAGAVDRRVLAVIAYLDSEGFHPTVSCLISGHGYLTSSGNVSEHVTGDAVDISAINGQAMIDNNQPGGLMEKTVRKIMQLQGTLQPHQIISLFSLGGATMALPDHNNHVHVGFRPSASSSATGGSVKNGATISKQDWYRVFDHLGKIKNPVVPSQPSSYAIKVNKHTKVKSGD